MKVNKYSINSYITCCFIAKSLCLELINRLINEFYDMLFGLCSVSYSTLRTLRSLGRKKKEENFHMMKKMIHVTCEYFILIYNPLLAPLENFFSNFFSIFRLTIEQIKKPHAPYHPTSAWSSKIKRLFIVFHFTLAIWADKAAARKKRTLYKKARNKMQRVEFISSRSAAVNLCHNSKGWNFY